MHYIGKLSYFETGFSLQVQLAHWATVCPKALNLFIVISTAWGWYDIFEIYINMLDIVENNLAIMHKLAKYFWILINIFLSNIYEKYLREISAK